MEDRSTLSVPAYILEYFFYAGIFIVWMDIFGMPDFAVPFTRTTLGGTQSGYVLAVMMLVSAFVGMVLTMRRYRTTFHVLVHLGTPICLYFLMALIRYSPILALIQGIVILTALSVYVLLFAPTCRKRTGLIICAAGSAAFPVGRGRFCRWRCFSRRWPIISDAWRGTP